MWHRNLFTTCATATLVFRETTWKKNACIALLFCFVKFSICQLILNTQHGREEEAKTILRKIYPAEDVEAEIQALKESVETEIQEKGSSEQISFVKLLKTKTVRRGLIAGVGLQVFQQFVGINTVMYYSPTIVQLAGFASNQTALLLSLVTAGLNALGSIVSIYFIDRTGRKKLLVFSLCGVIISLGVLSAVFHETTTHSPAVIAAETASFGGYMCPDYSSAGSSGGNWDCMKCLKASSLDCGFCASSISYFPELV
ncbi:hypothetical protein RHSIM_Rhsim09G0004600 [Rhododendron simsii]|uniref:Major facilitator superfamily (MFS) profile domain-containing protein n=1 Tax=Rhododendron simsii TaxID=118357 RepID=A0A834GKY0_RHOSS|nr:hypothetical protein RHSIM_Rhsim09G0004600 [Rhododendron simsii]